MKKRKLFAIVLTVLFCVSWMSACGDGSGTSEVSSPIGDSSSTSQNSVAGDTTTTKGNTSGGSESNAVVDKTTQADKVTVTTGNSGVSVSSTNTSNKSTSATATQTTKGQSSADKPTVQNTAALLSPMKGKSDAAATTMRNKILSAKDAAVSVSGKIYYVSAKGNDGNDGTSPSKAWRTIGKLEASRAKLRSGDAVLFERGGVYRGTFQAVSGVYYGAYGSGDKPAIYGSNANAAETAWTKYKDGIWVSPKSYTSDVGILVFDHGKGVGDKKFKMQELKEDYDFYYQTGKIYLRMSSEPSSRFSSIEVGRDSHLIQMPSGSSNITIDNLTLKYTGAHGISILGQSNNIKVTNCEIGWIGGSVQSGSARYGNGVELWNGGENIVVENCWIYQIYDTALSHQGRGEFVVKDLTFANNLVEYTSYGAIEYWAPESDQNELINITYSGNILRFSGYGWGELGRKAPGMGITGASDNKCTNMKIVNNIIDSTRVYPLNIVHKAGTLPDLEGNTLYQSQRAYIGCWGTSGSGDRYVFGDDALDILKNVFGDTTAKVAYND